MLDYTHRFWTLLLQLAKHKPEESKPAVQACHLICKYLKGIHLGAQACIWQAMSVRLFGRIPFGKCRKESTNFPEDSVTPRYEKTCNLSFPNLNPLPQHYPQFSEIHICSSLGGGRGWEQKKQQLSSQFSGSPRRYFTNVVFTFSGFWLVNKIKQKCSFPW